MDTETILAREAAKGRDYIPKGWRPLILSALMLLPIGVGYFHLCVRPLVSYPPKLSNEPATVAGSADATEPDTSTPVHPIYTRMQFAHGTLISIVFMACMVACILVGLVGVNHGLPYALFFACISTVAHMISDGQGAFLGPFVWTFVPFWPLIGLGKLIRIGVLSWRHPDAVSN